MMPLAQTPQIFQPAFPACSAVTIYVDTQWNVLRLEIINNFEIETSCIENTVNQMLELIPLALFIPYWHLSH